MDDQQNQAEKQRLLEDARGERSWKKWGPYLSERQWGTVRENESQTIEAWNDLHARPVTLARISQRRGRHRRLLDDRMLPLLRARPVALGKDPIIKERLVFDLTNGQGKARQIHGEDVKVEYYFYLDSTPTHSFAKMLYKYPQAAYPYQQLLDVNGSRSKTEFEYELLDTGIFDEDRYWDVYVEFAKSDPEDLHIRISAVNRGPEAATLHVLPHLWFRNTWWVDEHAPRPALEAVSHDRAAVAAAAHPELGMRYLYCDQAKEVLFTDNETNRYRLWGQPNPTTYQKDGINDFVISGRENAVNPAKKGTKAAAHYTLTAQPGETVSVRLRLTPRSPAEVGDPFGPFEQTFADRRREADEFYGRLLPAKLSDDAKNVVRQGFAGLLWTKQAYIYDLDKWLQGRGVTRESRDGGRNGHWFHMYSADIISMPDKWEYPWCASWDLAFHAVGLAFVDPSFAQHQLSLMLQERYQHPNGQLPAYEWNFDDVNPPVHAWATLFNYRLNRGSLGDDAIPFLKRTINLLSANFTWWLNRKDRDGRNLFEGGFLGLDNIGVFDRSSPLPTGGYLEQADGTAWMAFYAQTMLETAIELALVDPTYEDMAVKFYEQVVRIAHATNRAGERDALWDEEDGFFYDVLRVPGAIHDAHQGAISRGSPAPVRRGRLSPGDSRAAAQAHRADPVVQQEPSRDAEEPAPAGQGGRGRALHAVDAQRGQAAPRAGAHAGSSGVPLGDHGIRSLSRYHLDHPYVFYAGQAEYRVDYLPAESNTGMFGGNSNWRGPIWAPINTLIVRALVQMYSYYGDDFRVECPTGSGQYMNLFQVAEELSNRMGSIFLRDHEGGDGPSTAGPKKFVDDPSWSNNLLFFEYFHGDNGAGLGASHQTGWTATIPTLMHLFAGISPELLKTPERILDKVTREKTLEDLGRVELDALSE